MEVQKINTRFMQGNKTEEVFDLLADYYGMAEVCNNEIDFCECIYSDGFIRAIEQDSLIPVLGSHQLNEERKTEQEYHHFIYNENCYIIYFN
jgi:hypothetical protein